MLMDVAAPGHDFADDLGDTSINVGVEAARLGGEGPGGQKERKR